MSESDAREFFSIIFVCRMRANLFVYLDYFELNECRCESRLSFSPNYYYYFIHFNLISLLHLHLHHTKRKPSPIGWQSVRVLFGCSIRTVIQLKIKISKRRRTRAWLWLVSVCLFYYSYNKNHVHVWLCVCAVGFLLSTIASNICF